MSRARRQLARTLFTHLSFGSTGLAALLCQRGQARGRDCLADSFDMFGPQRLEWRPHHGARGTAAWRPRLFLYNPVLHERLLVIDRVRKRSDFVEQYGRFCHLAGVGKLEEFGDEFGRNVGERADRAVRCRKADQEEASMGDEEINLPRKILE